MEKEGDDHKGNSIHHEKKKRKFKRICVFCGSRPGCKSSFSDAALELGKQLVIYLFISSNKYIYTHTYIPPAFETY